MNKKKENKEASQAKDDKVKVVDFLNKKSVRHNRHKGFAVYLKVGLHDKIDTAYLEKQFTEYSSIRGGGL